MTTFRNLFSASLLASALLAPAVNADVGRALGGHPPALLVRDFATANVLSSEDRGAGISAALPHLLASLAGWVRQAGGG